jgi:alkyl hydroperoxide reductase subunit AhpC
MSLNLGDQAPNFTADTTHGMINFYEWMNNSWTVLLSHPKDFTPVCTTELIWLANNKHEFEKRNIKVISLSVEKLIQHGKWLDDIKSEYNVKINTPIIADKNMRIAKLYRMINSSNSKSPSKHNPVEDTTARSVYIVSPDKKIAAVSIYPINTGRNFNEIIRILDSLLVTSHMTSATPVNWTLGENCVIAKRDTDNESILGFPKEVDALVKSVDDYISLNFIDTNNVAC